MDSSRAFLAKNVQPEASTRDLPEGLKVLPAFSLPPAIHMDVRLLKIQKNDSALTHDYFS